MILILFAYIIGCVGATALIMHYSKIKPNPKSKCHKVNDKILYKKKLKNRKNEKAD